MNEATYRKEPPQMEMSRQESDYKQTRVASICLCLAFIALVTSITTCHTRSDTVELRVLKDRQMTCSCRPQ